jgi:uridylate kinase
LHWVNYGIASVCAGINRKSLGAISKWLPFFCNFTESNTPIMNYGRVLLKLSGESLSGDQGYGIDPLMLDYYCREVSEAVNAGTRLGIVIGGGNIYRGIQGASVGMDRVQGDYMGMLATVINGMALRTRLEAEGIGADLLSGLSVDGLTRKASRGAIAESFDSGRVVILAGGTGNPFFTTDTAAALRAAEMEAEVLLKGTRVDGVYTADPEKDPDAKRLARITFDEAIAGGYQILDITAFTMCRENNIPIVVFDITGPGNLSRVLKGEGTFTLVSKVG